MPEHTSFLTYLMKLFPGLEHNAHALGHMALSGKPVTEHQVEPWLAGFLIALVIVGLAASIRKKVLEVKESVVPDDELTLRTFMELFVGYFYGVAKDIMGPKRAKRFFPVIGTSALFIFFNNAMALIPGMPAPTSSLNVTLGCALLVFILFNYYGLKEQGAGYIKHLFGPWLGPVGIPINILIFFVEVISTCVRPVTLAVRLMINMAVDHLVLGTFIGMVAIFVPLPAMVLGVLVVCVQTLVFCLLTSVYIGLATEHDEHAHLVTFVRWPATRGPFRKKRPAPREALVKRPDSIYLARRLPGARSRAPRDCRDRRADKTPASPFRNIYSGAHSNVQEDPALGGFHQRDLRDPRHQLGVRSGGRQGRRDEQVRHPGLVRGRCWLRHRHRRPRRRPRPGPRRCRRPRRHQP